MIVDTSALIAVLSGESQAPQIARLLGSYSARISAATLVEARLVAFGRGGAAARRQLDLLVRRSGIEIAPFDADQADAAADAFLVYGRGSGHPARLNYGDTFSYALASVADEPLLFVGNDFSQTDLRPALEEYA